MLVVELGLEGGRIGLPLPPIRLVRRLVVLEVFDLDLHLVDSRLVLLLASGRVGKMRVQVLLGVMSVVVVLGALQSILQLVDLEHGRPVFFTEPVYNDEVFIAGALEVP